MYRDIQPHFDYLCGNHNDVPSQVGSIVPLLRPKFTLDFFLGRPKEIAIVGSAGASDTETLLEVIFEPFLPNKVVAGGDASIPLLAGRELRYGNSPIGRVPTQIDFADYRDVSGIKLPFRITYAWLDGRDSIVLNEIRTNVPVDEAKFGKPAPLKR